MKKNIIIIAIAIMLLCSIGVATYAIWDIKHDSLEVVALKTSFNVKINTSSTKVDNSALKLIPAVEKDGTTPITPQTNERVELIMGTIRYTFSTDSTTNVTQDEFIAKSKVSVASIVVTRTDNNGDVNSLFTVGIYDGATLLDTAGLADMSPNKDYTVKVKFSNTNDSEAIIGKSIRIVINLACTSRV